jgi:hypothetical protein
MCPIEAFLAEEQKKRPGNEPGLSFEAMTN